VRSLLDRCLVRDPEARLPSITAAREELEKAIAERALPSAVSGERRRAARGPNNLPTQLSSFVGRVAPLEKVQQLLRDEHVVTLTGAGGCGKTRLAIEAGWNALVRFADGVWLVELAVLEDPALVPATIVSALGITEGPGRTSLETLTDHLAERKALLILDNCERVLGACADLTAALLAACPGVRVLATSRQALRLDAESVYHVPLLDVPDDRTPTAALAGFESVRLFVERAHAGRPDFELNDETGPAVSQICRRLDGIPLAIELAAARVKVLPPVEIAKRLDNRFRLLRGRDAAPLAHHQTLHALIEWSYEHLESADQEVFRRLSVFSGGWTLEAAEAVCVGGEVEEWDVLDLLTELVDRSLVESGGDGSQDSHHARFRMLETVREYARARLEEAQEEAKVRGLHREHFLALAEEAEPRLTGKEQTAWLAYLSADHDNLRAALGAPGEGVGVKALRLGGALGRYWSVRGHWNEGRRVLAELLERTRSAPRAQELGKVLHWAGNLAFRQGDYREARARHEEALAVRRGIDDQAGIAASLDSLGAVAHDQGDHAGSLAFFEEALAIRREMGDRWAIAQSVNNLGVAIEAAGDYERAAELHREALEIRRELDDRWGIAGSLNNLGCALECLGDYAQAAELHEESLHIRRGLGDRWGIGLSLKNLGFALYRRGDLETPRSLFRESMEVFRELEERFEMCHSLSGLSRVARRRGDSEEAMKVARECLEIRSRLGEPRGIANSLEGLAGIAVDAEDWPRAAQLFGAAEGVRESAGAPVPAPERAQRERDLAALRAGLGDGLEREWAAGREMGAERAVRLGLSRSVVDR
jgi:non-specific serine/threonine protein kinase